MSQTITISKTGTYEIRFVAAQRKRTALTNGPIDQRTFNIAIDGVPQFTSFKPVRTDYSEALKTVGKQLTAGKHSIRIYAMAGGLASDIVLIDDVRLVRVGALKVEDAEEESRIEVAAATDAAVANAPLVLRSSKLYYRFGGKQVAVKSVDVAAVTTVTTWLHGDHLGSASFATYANGAKVPDSETRYTPFGSPRAGYEGKLLPTDKRFTGHQSEPESLTGGLTFMQARFYLAGVARFVSADTVVPNFANPQNYNRYSYTKPCLV